MVTRTYLIEAQFEARAVGHWIEAGWLLPIEPDANRLSQIDLARAQLIFDLTVSLGVNDEGVPVILDLIDQVHGLRRAMRELLERTRE
jgi:chaperone modulatory protein CbpM